MKKPTLEEVKDYFKDAEKIKSEYDLEFYIGKIFKNMGEYFARESGNNSATHTIWSKEKGYAKILTYKEPKFRPIAMRCTQEQFEAVKGKLENEGLNIQNDGIHRFYLTNDYNRNKIISFTACNHEDYEERTTYETWNEKIFLEACGIEVEEPKEESFVISKSKILQVSKISTHMDLVMRELFPSAFVEDKKELVLGKWYFIDRPESQFDDKQKALIFYENKEHLYGFSHIGRYIDNYCNVGFENYILTEATKQEVKEALEKEAVKREYKENLKYVECLCGFHEKEHQEYYKYKKSIFYYEDSVDKLWIQDGSFLDICIYSKGIWATIIQPKQMTQSDIEKELGYKIEIIN